MKWIAAAVAVYAVIEWAHMYALVPGYEWLQDIPIWAGHVAFGLMFSAAVIGIIKTRTQN